jgi:hypothetical protein
VNVHDILYGHLQSPPTTPYTPRGNGKLITRRLPRLNDCFFINIPLNIRQYYIYYIYIIIFHYLVNTLDRLYCSTTLNFITSYLLHHTYPTTSTCRRQYEERIPTLVYGVEAQLVGVMSPTTLRAQLQPPSTTVPPHLLAPQYNMPPQLGDIVPLPTRKAVYR